MTNEIMHHALFDSEGEPRGFYSSDIHAEPPLGAVEITHAQWRDFIENAGRRRWLAGDVVEYEPPLPPPTVDDYRRAIQSHVDAAAQARSYDSGVTCSSYVNSTIPRWAAEAAAFVSWRDGVWARAYVELAKVEGGEREQPSVADLVADLPAISWPE